MVSIMALNVVADRIIEIDSIADSDRLTAVRLRFDV
jgi:hypothetical protein